MSAPNPAKLQIRLAPPTRDVMARSSIPVWVANVNELQLELESRGAKRLIMIYHDLLGDSHTEGSWFLPSDLCDQHLSWLSDRSANIRELAYDIR